MDSEKGGSKNGSSRPVRKMAALCHLVNQWFIATLGFCGTIERNVLNWLVIVVDSEKGGSKNGSSRPVRKMAALCHLVNQWFIATLGFCGTIERNVLNCRIIVVDSEKGGSKNGSSRPVRKMAALCHLVNQWFIATLGFCGTIERNVLNWLVIVVDSEKGGSKNGSSRPVRKMAALCHLVNQWFIATLGFCGTIERNVLNWLVIVVDSEKGGSKNGSSRPVRKMAALCHLVNQWFIAVLGFCGTIQRNVLNWLVIVVDSEKGGSKNGSSRPVRKMAALCHLVNQWFIATLGFCGTIERNVLNWLVIVVDFEKGGSKNGSSLPVLPCGFVGLCWGKLFRGLGW